MMKLVYDGESGEIFGMHILSAHATDIIGEMALAMSAELTVGDVAATIHAHPTISEALMEIAHIAIGSPIHQ